MKKLKIGRRRNGGFIDLGAALLLAAGLAIGFACTFAAELRETPQLPAASAPDGWSMMAR